jgi:hypothetical protein
VCVCVWVCVCVCVCVVKWWKRQAGRVASMSAVTSLINICRTQCEKVPFAEPVSVVQQCYGFDNRESISWTANRQLDFQEANVSGEDVLMCYKSCGYMCLIQVQLDVHCQLQAVCNWPCLSEKGVPNQYLLQWNNTPNHTNIWLYAAVVLLMMGANSTRNMYS